MAPEGGPIRVLVVEQQAVLTPDVRARIRREPRFAVLSTVESAAEATRLTLEQPVDVVVVDSALPAPSAFD